MSNAELATSYAALILADDGVDITVRLRAGRAQIKINCSRPINSTLSSKPPVYQT
jgi:hypothetical protein